MIIAKMTLPEEGYVIYRGILEPHDCLEVANSIINETFELILGDIPQAQRPKLDYRILTDPIYRKTLAIPKHVMYSEGNKYQYQWSKTTGMINIHQNPKVKELIQFNPIIVSCLTSLYGHDNVIFRTGLERVSIKPSGTDGMKMHLDYHLFGDIKNIDKNRIQAFYVASAPQDVPVAQSGTIRVLPYFHLYWSVAQLFFNIHRHHPLDTKSYKNILPQVLDSTFESYLPEFNLFLQDLHNYAKGDKVQYQTIHHENLADYIHLLPSLPSQYHELRWLDVELKPNDLFCWSTKLPHGNLPNISYTPRIVAYISIYSRPANWTNSLEQIQLYNKMKRGLSYRSENTRELRILRKGQTDFIYVPTNLNRYAAKFFATLEQYQKFCLLLQGL